MEGNSQLTISEKNIGIKCVLDVRACRVTISLEHRKITIYSSSSEIAHIALQLRTVSTQCFSSWAATLLLHANLKPAGLISRLYFPKPIVSESRAILLQAPVYLCAPSLALHEFSEDITRLGEQSSFTPADWISVSAILRADSSLEFVRPNGSVVHQTTISALLSWHIRLLESSVFSLSNMLYIGDNSEKATVRISSEFIRHTRSMTNRNDKTLYVKLPSKNELYEWIRVLRSLASVQVYSPSTANPARSARLDQPLKIHVIEAKMGPRLPSATNKPYPEVYVEVCGVNRIWARTSLSKANKSPFWGEKFELAGFSGTETPSVLFRIMGRTANNFERDELIGVVELTYPELLAQQYAENWHPFKTEGGEGSLCVKVDIKELLIVASEYYADLKNNLKKMSCNELALWVISGDVNHCDLNPMSDLLLSVTLATSSERAVSWISALITEEIDKLRHFIIKKQGPTCLTNRCTEKQLEFKNNINNTLFRGNSVLTKSIDKFMKLVGHDHMAQTVGKFVREVVRVCPDLEIDPARVNVKEGETLEEATSANQERLLEFTEMIWTLLKTCVNDMPVSFKIIFKHLRFKLSFSLDQTPASVLNCVAGFLFLRFYCPALLNPKSFGFVHCNEVSSVQRSLTLVAKMLMGLANRARFGLKEPWMIPMNKFFDQHEDELDTFYKNVTMLEPSEAEVRWSCLGEYNVPEISSVKLSANTPLSERLSAMCMLDEEVIYCRLLRFWDQVLKPNKEYVLSIATSTLDPEIEIEKPGSSLGNTGLKTPKIGMKDIYDACESTHERINKIVSDLRNTPETFDPTLIKEYAKHISLSWDYLTDIVSLMPGIKPDMDWYTSNINVSKNNNNNNNNSNINYTKPSNGPVMKPLKTSTSSDSLLLLNRTLSGVSIGSVSLTSSTYNYNSKNFILDTSRRRNSLPSLSSLTENMADPVGHSLLQSAPRIYAEPIASDFFLAGNNSHSLVTCNRSLSEAAICSNGKHGALSVLGPTLESRTKADFDRSLAKLATSSKTHISKWVKNGWP